MEGKFPIPLNVLKKYRYGMPYKYAVYSPHMSSLVDCYEILPGVPDLTNRLLTIHNPKNEGMLTWLQVR